VSCSVLVAYATWAGSTIEVAESIAEGLRSAGLEAEVRPAKDVLDISQYDAVVAGAPVHAGRMHSDFSAFLKRNSGRLERIRVAYFVVCMTMKDDTEENRATSEGFLRAVRERNASIDPVGIGLFAGSIPGKEDARPRLSALSRFMLRATKAEAEDRRDPDAARAWGASIADRLSAGGEE